VTDSQAETLVISTAHLEIKMAPQRYVTTTTMVDTEQTHNFCTLIAWLVGKLFTNVYSIYNIITCHALLEDKFIGGFRIQLHVVRESR